MPRRSRLQEFNERLKKQHFDEQAIKEDQLKGSTIESVGKKTAEKHGVSAEDIFAIVARDSMQSFVKMWNNSMEDVIKETIRTEVKEVIREVVQEELLGAYKGILKGMTFNEESIVQQVEEKVEERPILQSVASLVVEDKDSYKSIRSLITKDMNYEQVADVMLENEIDPTKGANWTKVGGHASTLYISFMKNNKGIKGAWKVMMSGYVNNK